MTVNKDGFEILKDSKVTLEATARFDKHLKLVYKEARVTFEKKWSPKYGWQVIISCWQPQVVWSQLEVTDYEIKRGRIEICIPEAIARSMQLIPQFVSESSFSVSQHCFVLCQNLV